MAVLFSASIVNFWYPLHYSATPKQIAVNLTMLQTWLGVDDIEVSYWTLGVELKFGLADAGAASTPQNRGAVEAFCGLWLIKRRSWL